MVKLVNPRESNEKRVERKERREAEVDPGSTKSLVEGPGDGEDTLVVITESTESTHREIERSVL